MARLPDDVVKSLVRGVGAYMRKTPQNELPRSLRTLRNFREKALLEHAKQVLEALDDDALRARIVDWLGHKPALARADARTLEVATRREDGWEDALRSNATPKKTTKKRSVTDDSLRARVDEYKKRAAAAHTELRKVRQEARSEADRLRRDKEKMARELKSLAAEVKRARGEASQAGRRVKEAEAKAERERRRLNREAETEKRKSRERQDSLKQRLKALQEENAALKARARANVQKKAVARGKKSDRPAKREQLPVPKGLLEDARETLKEWLSGTDLTLIVDGYNVTKHKEGFGDLSLAKQRDRLVAELQRLSARFPKASIVCVFDGNEVPPGTARRKKGRVKIEYSSPDEIADDHIVALVQELPPDPVVVVTSDRDLQRRVKKHAATIATSPQLLEVTRKA
jgi:predicted RNA-binding protein with PIN domain